MKQKRIKNCLDCACEFEAVTADLCRPCAKDRLHRRLIAERKNVYKELGFKQYTRTKSEGKK